MVRILCRLGFGVAAGFVLAVSGCVTAGPSDVEEIAAAAPVDAVSRRRTEFFSGLRKMSPEEFPADNPLGTLLRGDEYGGALDAGRAVESWAEGKALTALLFAQASVGADPGNSARRTLLHLISRESGLVSDPEGELPRSALVRHELSRANAAFFEERFGEALQRARRAILLDGDSIEAWKARASAELALGDDDRAKASYVRAAALAPDDARLTRFLTDRGWK